MEFKDKYSWGGWSNCIYISNGEIDLICTTDVGPRIMRYGFMMSPSIKTYFKKV